MPDLDLHSRQLTGAPVQLLNANSNDVAVADHSGGHSLALETDSTWAENPWRWTPPGQASVHAEVTNVIVLKPGQIHTIHVSFDDPRWSVSKTGKPGEAKQLNDLRQEWNARFRFEYRPPDRVASAALPDGTLIWHGHLISVCSALQAGPINRGTSPCGCESRGRLERATAS